MLYYETLYIVHPALEAGRLKDLIVLVEKNITQMGGTTHTIDVWGKKKLAYPINKEKYGMYVLFQFFHEGGLNKEFNLTLEHNANILAYLTTKIEKAVLLDDKMASLDSQLGLLNPKISDGGDTQNTSKQVSDKTSNVDDQNISKITPDTVASEEITVEETIENKIEKED